MQEDAAATAAIGTAGFRGSNATILAPAVIDAVIEQTYSPTAITELHQALRGGARWTVPVAEREGQVVGFLHVDSAGAEPELHRISVERTQTGGGSGGAALLRELHQRLPAAGSYILVVLAPNTSAIRFYKRHGLDIERGTDAMSHYKGTMGFVPPDTPPVPALIMRYRRGAADVTVPTLPSTPPTVQVDIEASSKTMTAKRWPRSPRLPTRTTGSSSRPPRALRRTR